MAIRPHYAILKDAHEVELFTTGLTKLSSSQLECIRDESMSQMSIANFKHYINSSLIEELLLKLENGPIIVTVFIDSSQKAYNQSFKIYDYLHVFNLNHFLKLIESRLKLELSFIEIDEFSRLKFKDSISTNELELIKSLFVQDNNASNDSRISDNCSSLCQRIANVIGQRHPLVKLFEKIENLRSSAEVETILINTKSSYINLLEQAHAIGMDVNNQKVKHLLEKIEDELLSTIKNEVDVTVEEQSDVLLKVKSRYQNLIL